jgi:hypothetical protein
VETNNQETEIPEQLNKCKRSVEMAQAPQRVCTGFPLNALHEQGDTNMQFPEGAKD